MLLILAHSSHKPLFYIRTLQWASHQINVKMKWQQHNKTRNKRIFFISPKNGSVSLCFSSVFFFLRFWHFFCFCFYFSAAQLKVAKTKGLKGIWIRNVDQDSVTHFHSAKDFLQFDVYKNKTILFSIIFVIWLDSSINDDCVALFWSMICEDIYIKW